MQAIGALILIALIAGGIMVYQGDLKVKLPTSEEVQNAIDKVSSTDAVKGTVAQVNAKIDPVTIKAEVKSWILKDGIALPAGWLIKEKTLANGSTITIFVPKEPKNEDDYIAYKINVSLIRELPASAMCEDVKEEEAKEEEEQTVTCVVGVNPETHRVFDILTYLQK